MKYGRIVYGKNPKIQGDQLCNLGDVFQTLAVDRIYAKMGITEDQIVDISRYKLDSYIGEDVILVMNAWFGHGYPGVKIRNLSPQIHPVYFGFHCLAKKNIPLSLYDSDILVGCRDEGTFKLMKKEGINAFISGCSTLLFDKINKTDGNKKIYMVDLPENIRGEVKKHIGSDTVIKQQSIPIPNGLSEKEEQLYCDQMAKQRLEEYKNNAKILVTTRLHCTVPCIAMGIPVILIREHYDERFSWIERYTNLYYNKNVENVDWNPKEKDIETIKALMFDVISSMIRQETPEKNKCDELHNYYIERGAECINPPLKLRVYNKLHENMPHFTEFLRLKVLSRFSLESKTNKNIEK